MAVLVVLVVLVVSIVGIVVVVVFLSITDYFTSSKSVNVKQRCMFYSFLFYF